MPFKSVHIILGICLFSQLVIAQNGANLGATSISFNYSLDKYHLNLLDDPRSSIDSLLGIGGMSDEAYIKLRESVSNPAWSKTFGFKYRHNFYKNWTFISGLNVVNAKQTINPSSLTDTLLIILFSDQINERKFNTSYSFIEMPINFQYNFWRNDLYTGPKWRRHSFLSVGGGINLNVTTHKTYYFNFLEHSYILKNTGLSGNLFLNYHKDFENSWFFEIGGSLKTTLVNNYVYAPVKSNYSNYGLEVSIGKTFQGEPIKFQSKSILECLSFKKERNFELGVSAGLNTTFLFGPDRKSDFIPNLNSSEFNNEQIESVNKSVTPFYGMYIGIYSSLHLKGPFHLSTSPSYSSKGANWDYDYKINNQGNTIDKFTGLKMKLDYFDIPVFFNYKKSKNVFSVGLLSSVLFTDRLYEYNTGDDFSNNSPNGYYGYTIKNRALTYFGYKPRDFNWGYIIGYQREIDHWATINIQLQHTNEVFNPSITNYRFNMMTIKTGVNFFLYRKSK